MLLRFFILRLYLPATQGIWYKSFPQKNISALFKNKSTRKPRKCNNHHPSCGQKSEFCYIFILSVVLLKARTLIRPFMCNIIYSLMESEVSGRCLQDKGTLKKRVFLLKYIDGYPFRKTICLNLEHSLQRWWNLNFYLFPGTAYEFYSVSQNVRD